jgi:hypothetical protein
MFVPRKLSPVSMDPRRADTAVMTPMTENTPMVMPDIVRNERSLFTPREPRAILRISEKFMTSAERGVRSAEWTCRRAQSGWKRPQWR